MTRRDAQRIVTRGRYDIDKAKKMALDTAHLKKLP